MRDNSNLAGEASHERENIQPPASNAESYRLARNVPAFKGNMGWQARRARSDAPHHRGLMAILGDKQIVGASLAPMCGVRSVAMTDHH
jgi:hypothetical protein